MIKKYKVKVQTLAVCTLLFFSCMAGRSGQKDVPAIKIRYKAEFIDSSLQVIRIMDSIDIIYYQQYTLYMTVVPTDYMKEETRPNGHVEIRDIFKTSMDTIYVLFRNGDSAGIRFSLQNVLQPSRILKTDYFQHMNIAEGLKGFDSLHEQIVRTETREDSIVKVSVPAVADPGFADTSFYYFAGRPNNKPYSFSSQLEEQTGKTLVKIKARWNTYYDSAYQRTIPAREFVFSRTDFLIDEEIPERAISYFESHRELLRPPSK